jgi:hypothetical protein
MGDEVRNAGLTFDMLCCRIADGRHLGSGDTDASIDSNGDEVEVTDNGGNAANCSGGGGSEEEVDNDPMLPSPRRDPASFSMLLSYNSSSQTSIRRAISNMRDGPPERVVRFGFDTASLSFSIGGSFGYVLFPFDISSFMLSTLEYCFASSSL